MNGYNKEQKEELAKSFISECRAIARNMTLSKRYLFDEAESIAYKALEEAIRTHDPKRGKFPSHARIVVSERILDWIRLERPKGKGSKGKLLKQENIDVYDDKQMEEKIDLRHYERVGWEYDSEDYVTVMSKRLPKKHGMTIRLKYLHANSHGLAGLAENLGTQEPRAVQLHREALGMLREQIKS